MKIQILNLVIPEKEVQAFSSLFQTMFYLLLYSDAMNLGQSMENVFLVTLALSARERQKLRSTEDPLLKKIKNTVIQKYSHAAWELKHSQIIKQMKENTPFPAACVTAVLVTESIILPSPENSRKIFEIWGAWGQQGKYLGRSPLFLRRGSSACARYWWYCQTHQGTLLCNRLFSVFIDRLSPKSSYNVSQQNPPFQIPHPN